MTRAPATLLVANFSFLTLGTRLPTFCEGKAASGKKNLLGELVENLTIHIAAIP
jgi:hypothetical protein